MLREPGPASGLLTCEFADVDPDRMTPEELLGWKLSELKHAARAVRRASAEGDARAD